MANGQHVAVHELLQVGCWNCIGCLQQLLV